MYCTKVTAAIRELVAITGLPVVETFKEQELFQRIRRTFLWACWFISKPTWGSFVKRSDLVIAIGYDPIEYEAQLECRKDARVIVIDEVQMEIDQYMQPEEELIGDMSKNILKLSEAFSEPILTEDAQDYLETLQEKLTIKEVKQVQLKIGYIH